ncbi:hypothetical protein KKB83_01255 [Patescibacteria group bacterium]|nr:hypothetical protein [Patescibacteria group bacterium]
MAKLIALARVPRAGIREEHPESVMAFSAARNQLSFVLHGCKKRGGKWVAIVSYVDYTGAPQEQIETLLKQSPLGGPVFVTIVLQQACGVPYKWRDIYLE